MVAFPGPDRAGRIRALQLTLPDAGTDVIVISTPENIRYLCGFSGTAGLLLVTSQEARLITDGRYALAVKQGLAAGHIGRVALEVVAQRYDLTLGGVLARIQARQIGFEAGHVTVATLRAWEKAASGTSWHATERVVERQRLIKDAHEIDTLRRGGALISTVIKALAPLIQSGRTERAIAKDVDVALEEVGFTGPAFPTIVSSGPNSALPHARPTDRPLAPGDLVMLDFGGVLDGYCVDVTRMAAVRPLSDRAYALFSAVKVAQEAAILATRPGVLASDIDAAARSALESRGFGEAFSHSTGHGLGLEVHEAPRIGRAGQGGPEVIETGMVFTIEPGAYLEGFGGVRIEDDVLVTMTGSEVLTTAPRDLIVV